MRFTRHSLFQRFLTKWYLDRESFLQVCFCMRTPVVSSFRDAFVLLREACLNHYSSAQGRHSGEKRHKEGSWHLSYCTSYGSSKHCTNACDLLAYTMKVSKDRSVIRPYGALVHVFFFTFIPAVCSHNKSCRTTKSHNPSGILYVV